MDPDHLFNDTVQSDDLLNWVLFNMNESGGFDCDFPSSDLFPTAPFSPSKSSSLVPKLNLENEEDILNSDLENPDISDDKKVKKINLSKNSETSKLSRKRRRERMLEMEERLNYLKIENAELNDHLNTITLRTTETQKNRSEMEKLMSSHINSAEDNGKVHAELAELMRQYKEIYADYGNCRQREVTYHLQQLQRLLRPTKTTKMYLWTLQQEKSEKKNKPTSLFNILTKDLEISEDQAKQIQAHRNHIKLLSSQLQESYLLIQQLGKAIEEKHTTFDTECSKIQSEVSPIQSVKFLLWITRNSEKLAEVIPDFDGNSHVPNSRFMSSNLS